MFHVKHSSRSRTACPGRVRARRAARDGEKASNSEEAARLRRPRRAVAEARLPVDQALCGRRVSGASGARRKTSEFDGFLPWGAASAVKPTSARPGRAASRREIVGGRGDLGASCCWLDSGVAKRAYDMAFSARQDSKGQETRLCYTISRLKGRIGRSA